MKVSPASTSVGLNVPMTVPPAAFSSTVFADSAMSVGASLVLVTVSVKLSSTDRLPRSAALTLTLIVPTSPLAGVPLKVRVAALKLSQVGSALPSASVAL